MKRNKKIETFFFISLLYSEILTKENLDNLIKIKISK